MTATQTLIAFLGLINAGFLAFVAWQQYNLSRESLRLNLYDRRWAIYASVINMLAATCNDRKANSSNAQTIVYWEECKSYITDSPLLFGDEITFYFKDLLEKCRRSNEILCDEIDQKAAFMIAGKPNEVVDLGTATHLEARLLNDYLIKQVQDGLTGKVKPYIDFSKMR